MSKARKSIEIPRQLVIFWFLGIPVLAVLPGCKPTDFQGGPKSAPGTVSGADDGDSNGDSDRSRGNSAPTRQGLDGTGPEDANSPPGDTVGVPPGSSAHSSPSTPITSSTLSAACSDQSALKSFDLPILFAEPPASCKWDQNGNLGRKDGRLTARYEQTEELKLPTNAKICSLRIDFGGGAGQRIYYDDEILLAFDDIVLLSSNDFSDRLPEQDGFLRYDWNRIAGTHYSHRSPVYCLGADTGEGNCSVPPTQTTGMITVFVSDPLIRKIAIASGMRFGLATQEPSKTPPKLTFVTFGDNDSSIDCKHSPFSLSVSGKYVEID